jgi:NADPH:quinone reductase-like Zn-dependent oxidoreductase
MVTMKAALCTAYGSPEVMQIKEIPKPVPQENEILIKVSATTVSSADVRIRSCDVPFLFWLPFRLFMGFRTPRNKILGQDVAGEVTEIGSSVTLFKVGDQIFGSTFGSGSGANAEFMTIKESAVLAKKPANLNYNEAAAIFFGAHTALHFLNKGKIGKNQKVLIYGASGSIGTYAVQLAKYFGAHVTGLCSTSNLDLVKSLGADKVIDYTKDNFKEKAETYDIIFDTVGKSPFFDCVRSLTKQGYYLRAVHLNIPSILKGIWIGITTKKKVIGGVAGENLASLLFLRKLIEEGHLKPVIDKIYPLSEMVEAHRYVETGHKVGNVVVKIY